MRAGDQARHPCSGGRRAPVRGSYRGYEIVSMPPPSSGGVALVEMLNILEGYDLKAHGYNSPEALHLMVEPKKLAFEDRIAFLVEREASFRENRRLTRLLRQARFRLPACVEDLIFNASRGLDRSVVLRLSGCDWIHRSQVVLITGGSSGIGKAAAFKIAAAGAITIIVARDKEKLDETVAEAAAGGLTLIAYSADVSDDAQCAEVVRRVAEEHGGVDILINNAGRSIRRGIENSFDRMHDFDRTMQVNYFGSLRLTMGLLPKMLEKRAGHIINISSIGVLTNAPRFSAYVASKAALDAWTRCAASEFVDRGIEFTTINMPLVKTPMIAPTKLYDQVPTLTPEEAADLIVDAIVHRPVRIATRLGIFGQVLHAAAPRIAQIIMNTTYRMFPDSSAAKGKTEGAPAQPSADQIAFTQIMRGIHF